MIRRPKQLVAIAIGLLPIAAQPDTSVKGLIASASGYLSSYQKQLSFLLADEQITQRVFDGQGRETAQRVTRGEFFITYAGGNWTSVHDIAEADGIAVPNRDDLRELLRREPLPALGRRLIERNASFNIGSVTRNFNEPTLALLILDPIRRPQFRFDRARVERDRDEGATVATLKFRETGRPTLVRGMDGRDLFSTGDLTIEAGSGRIRETYMRFTYGPTSAQLITTYARDPKLDVWVPVTFQERYERTSAPREVIVCEASYSNYRRFEVNVRVR